MQIIKPTFEILREPDWKETLKFLEMCGRTCYKSEELITDDSASKFILARLSSVPPHEAVIEHASFSVRYIVDRGFTHEMVRMRLASYCQESTRYVNYGGKNMQFILPPWGPTSLTNTNWDTLKYLEATGTMSELDRPAEYDWIEACLASEKSYNKLLNKGWSPQKARTVLNNSVKTEIIMTANMREWRHVLKLRAEPAAHPQMYEIVRPLLRTLKTKCPELFGDIPDYAETEVKAA